MGTGVNRITRTRLNAHSVATALARSVFPVPGGPYNSAPLRPPTPPVTRRTSAFRFSGSSTISRIAALTSSNPPTSDQEVVGTEGAPIAAAARRSSHVTAARTSSGATRAPGEEGVPAVAAAPDRGGGVGFRG